MQHWCRESRRLNYYAWGETEPKENYTWETYKWCEGTAKTLTKYCSNSEYGYNGFTDNKSSLDLEDDAAHVHWGGEWRMPTEEELKELLNNTEEQVNLTTNIVTLKSKKNGNSIKLKIGDKGCTIWTNSIGVNTFDAYNLTWFSIRSLKL